MMKLKMLFYFLFFESINVNFIRLLIFFMADDFFSFYFSLNHDMIEIIRYDILYAGR